MFKKFKEINILYINIMERIKNIIEEDNKKLIDYTYKIKSQDDFIKLIDKIGSNDKYINFVFLLEVHKLSKNIKNLLVNMGAIPQIITNDLIILFHKDNYFYVHSSTDYNKLNILKFINENEKIYNCCVCLNDCFTVTTCRHCTAIYCRSCIKNINSNCAVCRKRTSIKQAYEPEEIEIF